MNLEQKEAELVHELLNKVQVSGTDMVKTAATLIVKLENFLGKKEETPAQEG